jgi:hypothetical protein
MRLPRVRFTLRSMMIAAAVVGLASGVTVESGRRRQRFLRAYRGHALAEYECSIKAQILLANMGAKGTYRPSLSEVAAMWRMDAEERRLLEADGEDLRAMMRDAGWKNPRSIPLRIDITETMKAGGLGSLLRREDYHRRLRKTYARASRYPWLPVSPDPQGPG